MSDIYHIYDIKPEMNLIIICSIADVEKFIRYLWAFIFATVEPRDDKSFLHGNEMQ